ncbi:unnamed protein product [Heligmosomoides polygyrus]|uniref:Amino acid transporter n=1 Tax=Heligmosomoides polygyrus TaxID=6339 RepID=A0A183FMU0_HELPZ|nr:unnamed protein product [Heligmosomoides polygyrus]
MERGCCRQNLLFFCTGASVLLGVGFGLAARTLELSADTIAIVQFPGEVFMRLLKLMILPLVVASLISALAQMDVKNSSLMGVVTSIYYLVTVFLATLLGIFLVLAIHPGDPKLSSGQHTFEAHKISAMDTILDLIRNMFPDNIVQASFERTRTVHRMTLVTRANESVEEITKEVAEQRGINILGRTRISTYSRVQRARYIKSIGVTGIIAFCIGFGVVMSYYADKVRVLVDFFVGLDMVIMRLMLSVMWFAPFGITSLICGSLLELEDVWTVAGAMTKYIVTVLIGVFAHSFVTIPALYVLVTKKNPLMVFRAMLQGGVAALGTSSS